MPDGFVSLADAFNKEPIFDGLRKRIKESDVVANFYTILPDLKKIAVPVKVEKKTLYLKVENAAWRSELKYSEKTIISKVNDFYKEERIRYLRFSS
ncbi:MAG: DUF721 domain-containing protein [Ignavibacteriaceae bacterium]